MVPTSLTNIDTAASLRLEDDVDRIVDSAEAFLVLVDLLWVYSCYQQRLTPGLATGRDHRNSNLITADEGERDGD